MLNYLSQGLETNVEKAFDRIRQWLMTNKDNVKKLKASMTYQDADEKTPLHLILCDHPPLDIIQIFIKYAPEVLQMEDITGSLPIHVACYYKASLEVIQALLTASPDTIKVTDTDGWLPLYNACYVHDSSLEVLNLLIDSYPEGVDQKSRFGDSPLDIFREEKYAEKKDHNGMLLLHHACRNEYSLHLIHFLIQVYPESATVPDNDGNTPLQYLSKTASRVDNKGMLLLHREATNVKGLNMEMLLILFHANPEAIRLQDKLGWLPIHHASLNQAASLEALMLLIKLYPESVAV